MKSPRPFLALALAAAAGLSTQHLAQADGHVGNGGGAWTCRSNGTDDKILWIQLVDLSEARREYQEPVPVTGNMPAGLPILGPKEWLVSNDPYLLWAESKIKIANPQFYAEYLLRKADLANRITVPKDSDFDHTSDIRHHSRPDDSTCVGGHILQEPEQLANFTYTGNLEINGKLWFDPSLSEIDRAALFVHEIVYWMLRDTAGDTDSLRARLIVGYLFSATKPISQYKSMITLTPAPENAATLPLQYGRYAELTGHWVDIRIISYDTATQVLQLAQEDRDENYKVKSISSFKCVAQGSEYQCTMSGSTKYKESDWVGHYIRIIDPNNFVWVKLAKSGSVVHTTHYSKQP